MIQLLIGLIIAVIAIHGIVHSDGTGCDHDCDHCPFPRCDDSNEEDTR